MKIARNLATFLHIFQKIPENYCPCLYLSTGHVWWLSKLWFKRYIQKCTLSHVPILIMTSSLVNHGMVKNTKAWISWEWKITFLRNKKILNLYLRWHILRSYHFVVEVTFKVAEFFWNFRGGGLYLLVGPGTFCPISYNIYN